MKRMTTILHLLLLASCLVVCFSSTKFLLIETADDDQAEPAQDYEGEENPTERSKPVGGPKKDIKSSLRKCKAGESYFDGCNRCTCPDPEKRGVGMCTMAWCSKYSTPDCVCEFK